jgi:hypothetical protein
LASAGGGPAGSAVLEAGEIVPLPEELDPETRAEAGRGLERGRQPGERHARREGGEVAAHADGA